MERFTKKQNNNYVIDNYLKLNEPFKSPINKLGKLEDIEHIKDKSNYNGKVVARSGVIMSLNISMVVNGMMMILLVDMMTISKTIFLNNLV